MKSVLGLSIALCLSTSLRWTALSYTFVLQSKRSRSSGTVLNEKESDNEGDAAALAPPLRLYNAMERGVGPFLENPSKGDHGKYGLGTICMYTCGPTLYDSAHVGNFRAFLTYDLIKRVMREVYKKEVVHVCNLTDVDDKIIKKCRDLGVEGREITEKYEKVFYRDLRQLNCVMADHYPKATSHIPEVVDMIKSLEKNGLAYRDQDGWWFDTSKDQKYGGVLVEKDDDSGSENENPDGQEQQTAQRVRGGNSKDFALWKFPKPSVDVPSLTYDTSIGAGRPGWHIECSAISKSYFGDAIDLHMGGVDLKFPHHENEIAQSEGAWEGGGEGMVGDRKGRRWCGCWVHNGFVDMKGVKMSKSLGN